MERDEITRRVIGAAIEVHREIGPGLLESAYEACMTVELLERELEFQRQYPIRLNYKGAVIDCGYRVDLLIEEQVLVELKSVEKLAPIHDAQILSYLKATGFPLGLLINFNVLQLTQGIRRLVL